MKGIFALLLLVPWLALAQSGTYFHDGNVDIGGTLDVNGAATFEGGATFNTSLITVSGGALFDSGAFDFSVPPDMNGGLDVLGGSQASGRIWGGSNTLNLGASSGVTLEDGSGGDFAVFNASKLYLWNNGTYDATSDNLIIAPGEDSVGLTIRSDTSSGFGSIAFADGDTSNADRRAGRFLYSHPLDQLSIYTADAVSLTISSTGEVTATGALRTTGGELTFTGNGTAALNKIVRTSSGVIDLNNSAMTLDTSQQVQIGPTSGGKTHSVGGTGGAGDTTLEVVSPAADKAYLQLANGASTYSISKGGSVDFEPSASTNVNFRNNSSTVIFQLLSTNNTRANYYFSAGNSVGGSAPEFAIKKLTGTTSTSLISLSITHGLSEARIKTATCSIDVGSLRYLVPGPFASSRAVKMSVNSTSLLLEHRDLSDSSQFWSGNYPVVCYAYYEAS